MGYKVAVIGATGNVGCETPNILSEQRQFPADEVIALASRRSVGQEATFGDRTEGEGPCHLRFLGRGHRADEAQAPALPRNGGPKIGAQGCVVIDNSSFYRMDPDVPLIVPEVNADAIAGYAKKNIIANPNCSTVQMVAALLPIHKVAAIKRVMVSTYQSVSGAGHRGDGRAFQPDQGDLCE